MQLICDQRGSDRVYDAIATHDYLTWRIWPLDIHIVAVGTWLLVKLCEVQVLYRFVSVLNDQGFLEGKYVPVIDGQTQNSPAAPPATPESASEPAIVASSTDLGSSNGDGSAVQEGGTDVPTSEPAPSKWDGLNESHLKNFEPQKERKLTVVYTLRELMVVRKAGVMLLSISIHLLFMSTNWGLVE